MFWDDRSAINKDEKERREQNKGVCIAQSCGNKKTQAQPTKDKLVSQSNGLFYFRYENVRKYFEFYFCQKLNWSTQKF